MTDKEIEYIVWLLEKYSRIANKPDKLNNIIIEGHTISIIQNGIEIGRNELSLKNIKKIIDNIGYEKNVFLTSDCLYSPFEADTNENSFVWKKEYKHICFPCFISVILFTLLAFGKIPSISEYCRIYLLAYTEAFDPECGDKTRNSLYKIPNYGDRNRLGKITVFEGFEFPNNLLRFKREYICYLSNFPINEFTTEHLCNRIYKVYGSLIRDVYNTLYFDSLGQKSYYDFLDDLEGIDLMLNDIPIFAYVNSKNGKEAREKKIKERHPNLANIGIALEKDMRSEKSGGIYLIDEVTANKAIEYAEYLNEKGIQRIIRLPY